MIGEHTIEGVDYESHLRNAEVPLRIFYRDSRVSTTLFRDGEITEGAGGLDKVLPFHDIYIERPEKDPITVRADMVREFYVREEYGVKRLYARHDDDDHDKKDDDPQDKKDIDLGIIPPEVYANVVRFNRVANGRINHLPIDDIKLSLEEEVKTP